MLGLFKSVRLVLVAAGIATVALASQAAAQQTPAPAPVVTAQDAYAEMRALMGGVPSFAQAYPEAGIAGAWILTRDLAFGQTALDAKTKALISLAVAAQIPCQYCIWSDTRDALAAGASQQEIAEAVAIAGLTRHWSTIFNGLQIDVAQYKRELGGE